MKKIAILLLAAGALLSGCIVYDTPHRDSGMHRGDRDGERDHDRGRNRDRDHDGFPDRIERRP